MGQKIRPDSYRIGVTKGWNARWFAGKTFGTKLQEDVLIRRIINERIKLAGIVRVEIERNANNAYRIFIKAAKPGIIIGRGGTGIDDLTKELSSAIAALHRERGAKNPKVQLSVNIEELKRTEISAQFLAQSLAWELEKRMPFRRTMKKAIENTLQNRDIKGIKIKMSGRLDGNEIARNEFLAKGTLPLTTLRADIDYGTATALCTYGAIGIKVWLYKGLIFAKDAAKKPEQRS
jgi:small subunit ribosomal protein S3